jgi:hypothetical protein
MSYSTASPHSLQQHPDSNEHVYFSRITQQWEPVWFYATMLKKLSSFAQAIDRCAPSSRELVWSHIFSLYNQANRKCSDLFGPIIDEWCHSQAIDLSAIEIMYTSFLQIYNQYPGLFEDMLAPASSPIDHSLSYSTGIMDGKMVDLKKEDKPKAIKLSNTSLIWGNTFPASIQQFSLLLNWAPLLEKLPPNQKEAIWNTCQFFPLFTDSFDRSSFRKTFLKWASNIYAHLSHITILFASIGFLRDKGIIKHQFFFPNTTVPVFNNGAKTPSPPTYPPSSPHPSHQRQQHFSPASPVSPSSSSSSPSHRASPSTSRSPSPVTPGADFQSQPLHHFYPTLPGTPAHPVLPTLDGLRNPKSLPFDSLSLPPLTLSSTPLATPPSGPGTSSSRLGLLALAAFQADDTTEGAAPQPSSASIPFPPLSSRPLPKDQDAQTSPIKREAEPKPELPKPAPAPSSAPLPAADAPETQQPASILAPAAPIKREPAMMKIIKRKNSCSDYHNDDESKRPRTMNLSHILCS